MWQKQILLFNYHYQAVFLFLDSSNFLNENFDFLLRKCPEEVLIINVIVKSQDGNI